MSEPQRRYEVRFLEKLAQDPEALRAAYLASAVLIDARWHAYYAASWDQPAVAVFAAADCVAGINWKFDETELRLAVNFAWCTKQHPAAFAIALTALRRRAPAQRVNEVSFACHPDNEPMMKLVEKMKLRPVSLSFRIPGDRLRGCK